MEADVRIQLSSVKPDSKDIYKNVKSTTFLTKLVFIL